MFSLKPFRLLEALTLREFRLDAASWLAVGVIVIGFLSMGSQMVFPPGIAVNLPHFEGSVITGRRCDAVLTVTSTGLCFFENRVYSASLLEDAIKEAAERLGRPDSVLLVKADASLDAKHLMQVFKWAHAGGFSQVQWAAY
jgi:biopolymer transport protein ExbD